MAVVKFVPAVCKGESPSFEGFISLKMWNFDEKFKFLEDLELEVDGDGKVAVASKQSNIATLRRAVKSSKAFYTHVELKHIASGAVFSNYDQMTEDALCHEILIEVATFVMGGYQMGND